MRQGKNSLQDRAADEVIYYDSKKRTTRAFGGPQIGKEVPLPYEGGLEPMDANGGWIASAVDLMRFARAFDDPSHCPILKSESVRAMLLRPEGAAGHEKNGKPKAVYYASGWWVDPVAGKPGLVTKWHNGGICGTESFLLCRNDKTNWAVLFNGDCSPEGKYFSQVIDPLLHKAANETKDWPAEDLFPSFYPSH